MSKLTTEARHELPGVRFAFPKQRKEPLENGAHVRNAVARFNQVTGVTNAERDAAWLRIELAAQLFGVRLHETGWRELKS
jgi:hypothetical protein